MGLGIRTNVQTMDDVRMALADIVRVLDRMASTNNGDGASMISVEDAGGNWTGTDLETVLDEIDARLDGGGL